jgi:4,5-dihydroxyphthalate decarboxylase
MPAGITSVSTTDDLETLLVEGRIDALMAGRPRDLQRPAGQRQLRCIVDDAEGVERAYFDATGMFPIMHTVVLHERFTNQPALAKRVFDAYVQAKKAALKRRLGTTLLPFADRLWDRFGPPSGDDPYRHGLTELNRKNIATLSRYLFEQGFIARQPEIDALFFDASASWQDE